MTQISSKKHILRRRALIIVFLIFFSPIASAEESCLFPLGNKILKEEGITFPPPFGISMVLNRVKDETEITNFSLPFSGEIQAIDFKGSESTTDACHVRADLWLLPFMNIYAVGGFIEGNSKTTIEISGTGPTNPSVEFDVKEDFHGTSMGIGTTLVYGFSNNWIVALDINFTEVELDVSHSDIKAAMIAPRIIYDFKGYGLPGFVGFGGHYLDAEQTLTVVIPSQNDRQERHAQLHIKNKKNWNLALNAGFEITNHWYWMAEVGFYDRNMFITQLNYRFP